MMAATYHPGSRPSHSESTRDQVDYTQIDAAIDGYNPESQHYQPRKSHDVQLRQNDASIRTLDGDNINDPAMSVVQSIETGTNQGESSAWIHRDKLARIEDKEIAEAGLRVRRPSSRQRTSWRYSGNSSASWDSPAPNQYRSPIGSIGPGPVDTQIHSPHTYDGSYEGDDSPSVTGSSIRARDRGLIETQGFGFEDAPDDSPRYAKPHTTSRPGTSRIPVSRNSPAPLSHFAQDRDSPIATSRSGSLAFSSSPEPGLGQNDSESRSQGLASHSVLENPGDRHAKVAQRGPASTGMSSPPMSDYSPVPPTAPLRSSSKTPKPAALNLNISKGKHRTHLSPQPRIASSPSSMISPRTTQLKTSPRQHSVNRPEGDAPWLATMYKPDPMLPPDQQILPTHAKKLLQERWAREGSPGASYDKDFNVLGIMDIRADRPMPSHIGLANGDVNHGRHHTPADTSTTAATAGIDTSRDAHDDPIKVDQPPRHWSQRPSESPAASPRQVFVSGGYRITPIISNNSDMNPNHTPEAATVRRNSKRSSSSYRLQIVDRLPGEEEVSASTPRRTSHRESVVDTLAERPEEKQVYLGHREERGDMPHQPTHALDMEKIKRDHEDKVHDKEERRARRKEEVGCRCVVM